MGLLYSNKNYCILLKKERVYMHQLWVSALTGGTRRDGRRRVGRHQVVGSHRPSVDVSCSVVTVVVVVVDLDLFAGEKSAAVFFVFVMIFCQSVSIAI